MRSVEGIVDSCCEKPRGCGGRITVINLSFEEKKKEFNVVGNHRINVGERVVFYYEQHTGVNWVERYNVLGPENNVIYSCIV